MINFSLGLGARSGGLALFDPATLSLTGWHRASYAGSPWAGTASAGSSNGRDLTEGTNPPSTGAAVNGLTPADFDGTNDLLGSGAVNNNTFLSATASSVWVLFYANSGFAHGVNAYDEGTFLTDATNAETVFGFTNDGIHVSYYDGGFQRVDVAASALAWTLAQFKHDGTNLKARVNSGSWSSTACGTLSFLTPSAFQVGRAYAGTHFFDGKILEIGISNTTFSDATFDNIKSYVNARYALSL